MKRREFLALAAGVLLARPGVAAAAEYPSRPVRMLVGFAAGGTTDIVTRLIGQWLSERLGQPFMTENRPGANTNLATEAAARADPDGYTLAILGSTQAINESVYRNLNVRLIRDFVFIAGLNESPLVLEVHPSVPVRTVPELVAYVKANPGKVTLASFGTGSISHVAGELFKIMTETGMLHVPYRGSTPMLTDLLGGHVQVAFDNLPASVEHIRAGRLRALAVTTAKRSDALPDVPVLSNFVPGLTVSALFGVAAPKNTPAEIVEQLSKEINAGLADPKLKARFAELGGAPLIVSPAEFTRLIADEVKRWANVVQRIGLKQE